jgi:integrase
MSLYKRKDSQYWWVKITIPGQPPVQRSTGTEERVAAQEFHDRLRAELWRVSRLGESPTYYWEDAVLRFLGETQHKRDHQGDRRRLQWLHAQLEGTPLQHIDRDRIERIMQAKHHRAAGTVNRYLATIRTILRKAEREWGWIERAPVLRMRVEPRRRVRWITQEEAARLLAALPAHLAPAAEFSLATGLRQANVLGLRWAQIDRERQHAWIHADQTKAKRDLGVPLNSRAMTVLRRCEGKHSEYVFTYRGEPFQGVDNQTWKRACRRAGITNFRWHDLRHTWASWHVQAGTSLHTLMELGGWACYEMVLRYAHLASNQLQAAAANIDHTQNNKGTSSEAEVTNQLRCTVIPFPQGRASRGK